MIQPLRPQQMAAEGDGSIHRDLFRWLSSLLPLHGAVSAAEGSVEFVELSADPSAGAESTGRLYLRDNGAGKTQLCIRFNTGAVQVIATQP